MYIPLGGVHEVCTQNFWPPFIRTGYLSIKFTQPPLQHTLSMSTLPLRCVHSLWMPPLESVGWWHIVPKFKIVIHSFHGTFYSVNLHRACSATTSQPPTAMRGTQLQQKSGGGWKAGRRRRCLLRWPRPLWQHRKGRIPHQPRWAHNSSLKSKVSRWKRCDIRPGTAWQYVVWFPPSQYAVLNLNFVSNFISWPPTLQGVNFTLLHRFVDVILCSSVHL